MIHFHCTKLMFLAYLYPDAWVTGILSLRTYTDSKKHGSDRVNVGANNSQSQDGIEDNTKTEYATDEETAIKVKETFITVNSAAR